MGGRGWGAGSQWCEGDGPRCPQLAQHWPLLNGPGGPPPGLAQVICPVSPTKPVSADVSGALDRQDWHVQLPGAPGGEKPQDWHGFCFSCPAGWWADASGRLQSLAPWLPATTWWHGPPARASDGLGSHPKRLQAAGQDFPSLACLGELPYFLTSSSAVQGPLTHTPVHTATLFRPRGCVLKAHRNCSTQNVVVVVLAASGTLGWTGSRESLILARGAQFWLKDSRRKPSVGWWASVMSCRLTPLTKF